MLKLRIITAVALAVLFISGVLFLNNALFALVMGFVLLLGAYEWSAFASMRSIFARITLIVGVAISMWLFHSDPLFIRAIQWVLYAATLWWVVVFVAVMTRTRPIESVEGFSPAVMLSTFMVFVPSWIAMVMLHAYPDRGPYLLLYAFSIVWVADIAAYFSGKKFGKNKLAPMVSPGKTREGLWGALVCMTIYSAVLAFSFGYNGQSMLLFVLVSVIAGLLSVGGDLFESVMKRRVGLKDSGNLLPGHGGLMDRLDSATAALPVFLSGALLAGLL